MSPVEGGNDLDVMGLRKQVVNSGSDVVVSGVAQQPGVAGQGHRITADQHDSQSLRLNENGNRLSTQTAARRVGDDEISTPRFPLLDL